MKSSLACALALVVCCACSQDIPQRANNLTAPNPSGPSSTTLAVSSRSIFKNFRAHLSGDQIVAPPLALATLAQGQAIFQLDPDGTELSYKLIASNIENVVGGHIHLGAANVRGPLVVVFGQVPPGGGRTDGVFATGTITAANLLPPPSILSFSAFIAEIEAGNAYVDVPTNDGVAPPNTGPGDYVGGELRGQVH